MLNYSEIKQIVLDSKKFIELADSKLAKKRVQNVLSIHGLSDALQKAVEFVIDDRVTKNVYHGGWSNTASKYVGVIYGEEYAASIHESMTDTAIAVEALSAYELCANIINKSQPFNLYDPDLKEYLQKRWNSQRGDSGTYKVDREGPRFYGDHIRHTAMIVRIFSHLPSLRNNLRKSSQYLVDRVLNMSHQDWKAEKIATPVAIYGALKRIEESPDYVKTEDVREAKKIVIDEASSRYDPELFGWYSGPYKDISYTYYSLFLLAELADEWSRDNYFTKQMNTAYDKLLSSIVTCDFGVGIPHNGKDYPDIGLSSLMICALLQKPHLVNKEISIIENMASFLVKAINHNEVKYWENTYTWTLSYFIIAMCNVLTN